MESHDDLANGANEGCPSGVPSKGVGLFGATVHHGRGICSIQKNELLAARNESAGFCVFVVQTCHHTFILVCDFGLFVRYECRTCRA